MGERRRRRRRPRAWGIALGVLTLSAGLAVLAWNLVPVIASAAMVRVAVVDETIELNAGPVGATVAVPAGWSIHPTWNAPAEVRLESPYGSMTVHLAATAARDAAAIARTLAEGPLEAEVTEPDGPDRELIYARAPGADAVVGYLQAGANAVAFGSTPSPGSDAELAQLLEGIEIAP